MQLDRLVFRLQKDCIHFDVSDTGVGMDKEIQKNLFTPLFSSKGDKGTGLGLFIANKIVAQHGGKIDVKSTPGQGSLFSVKIPKKPPASAKKPKIKPKSNSAAAINFKENCFVDL